MKKLIKKLLRESLLVEDYKDIIEQAKFTFEQLKEDNSLGKDLMVVNWKEMNLLYLDFVSSKGFGKLHEVLNILQTTNHIYVLYDENSIVKDLDPIVSESDFFTVNKNLFRIPDTDDYYLYKDRLYYIADGMVIGKDAGQKHTLTNIHGRSDRIKNEIVDNISEVIHNPNKLDYPIVKINEFNDLMKVVYEFTN